MPSIRKVLTASGATAVQIVGYKNRRAVVLKHVGSAHSESELEELLLRAGTLMAEVTGQPSLFQSKEPSIIERLEYQSLTHPFARYFLLAAAKEIGLHTLKDHLLLDLALMRIIEPASKLRSVELLERYFGITYRLSGVYEHLPRFVEYKEKIEALVASYAQKTRGDDLALVLYDVTTLYFETFQQDELRIPGFSKDNKAQQPQIVVGLLVTREGFPLGYEVFQGNTFEGKTMLPVLRAFSVRHGVKTPTVVADAAMLARTNIEELEQEGFSYIVGARLANASPMLIKDISKTLNGQDGATTRTKTKHGDLIASFSLKRFRKDKREMEKQVERAKALAAKQEPGKRAKFVSKGENDTFALDEALVEKTTLLLGIKGYYTNIPQETLSDMEVILRYHDLWNVEASFRMTKSDLATRPIFHYKEEAVRAHLLICFVALAIGKMLELASGLSLRKIRDLLWSITDVTLRDTVTDETVVLRSSMEPIIQSPLGNLMKTLGMPIEGKVSH